VRSLAIAAVNLRRFARQRANLFFVLVLPLLIVAMLGLVFGATDVDLGVVQRSGGPLAEQLSDDLGATEDLAVVRYEDESALERAVQRGRVEAGLVVPDDYTAVLEAGGTATVRWIARPGTASIQLRQAVEAAVARQGTVLRAARFVAGEQGGDVESRLAAAATVAAAVPGVDVEVRPADETVAAGDLGQFDLGAATQLVLFVFLTSLFGAPTLIEVRRLGLSRRMLSTPTRHLQVLLGESLGRLAIALVQAAIIVVGSALLFGVAWGSPPAAAAIVACFALVGASFAMLLGSALSSDQQAGALALVLGLGLAALGGSMVPLEVFPDRVRTIAHVTPHAWANDAFAEVLRHGGGLVDVLAPLAVLLAYAAVVFSLAAWFFRRAVTG